MAQPRQALQSDRVQGTQDAVPTMDDRAVASASALFLERGIAQVKMTEIADAADVGVATLYRHFATKAAIATAVGIRLWGELLQDYVQMTGQDSYRQLSGAGQLKCLLETYCDRYLYRPGFAAFFDELDRLVLAGEVNKTAVAEYTRMVEATYPIYAAAYEAGCADGSVAPQADFSLFYRSVAHALLCVASKLQRGEVLPTDDFSTSSNELTCLVDIAVTSLRARD